MPSMALSLSLIVVANVALGFPLVLRVSSSHVFRFAGSSTSTLKLNHGGSRARRNIIHYLDVMVLFRVTQQTDSSCVLPS